MKRRLDVLLVERGLAHSRETAQGLIMTGRVAVDGRRVDKPGARVEEAAGVDVAPTACAFVGRGGLKLQGALEAFDLEVTGLTAIDVGSSTGGFTDCLLRRGAARVFAVDVGRGQLDWSLRIDPRVVVCEGINARHLDAAHLPGLGAGADLAVVDVAFISLKLILLRLPPLLRRRQEAGDAAAAAGDPAPVERARADVRGSIVALVKPQFEVGRGRVGPGGVVRDAARRGEAVAGVALWARAAGLGVAAMAPSPIEGAQGNREYFLLLRTAAGGLTPEEIEEHAFTLARGGAAD